MTTSPSVRPQPRPAGPTPFPWAGLVALAVATFLSITGEMLPTGLLPEMSGELGVSESSIGLLVSVFAFTVVLTSTGLTHLTRRVPRHRLIVGLLLVLAVSAVASALAPSYALLVVARVLGGLAHGVFWAVGGAYAARLVRRDQVGRALAVAMSGGTLAFVLGVPLSTAVGQALGWRAAFVLLAVLLLVGAALVWRLLPDVGAAPAGDDEPVLAELTETGAARVVAADAETYRHRPRPSVAGVVISCVVTAVFMIGHYSFYTYIAPFLTRQSGVPEAGLSGALFAFGIAGAVGLGLVGWFLGARPRLSVPVGMAVTAVSVAALLLLEGQTVASLVALVVWGITFGALPPLLQTRMLQVAPDRIRDLASAFYTTGFNVGIGGGALVGAIVLDGVGLAALPVLYVVVAVVVLVVVVVTDRWLAVRSTRARPGA
ncbi:MFS transporter [Frigoribacterium salinisoli]